MKPKFYFNGAWVYAHSAIDIFQFTVSKQNNLKINTNLKPIHEYHFSLNQLFLTIKCINTIALL